MLTLHELEYALLIPAVIAALITGLGLWRGWAWLMPAAAGLGFLAGYFVLSGVPGIPPQDGTDWLFWATIPLIVLAVVDATIGKWWGWAFGAAAGGVALLIVAPLAHSGIGWGTIAICALLTAACGAAVALVAQWVEPRLGSRAIAAALCITLGAAAVVVLSSNSRVVGTYGLAAAAAMGSVAILIGRLRAARSVAILASGVLTGLLIGGHYYPEPGVPLIDLVILMLAPLLILPFAMLPARWTWWRGVVAVVAVAVVVGSVTVPTALKAKRAAEGDPYAGYSR